MGGTDHHLSVDFHYGYTARDRDEESGLNYHRARYFDPATDRWMSQDPIRFAAGDTQLYRYVTNDPISFADANGLSPNKRGARKPAAVIRFIEGLEQDNPTLTPAEILDLYQNVTCHNFVGQFPMGTTIGITDEKPDKPIPWHYVFTDDHGWIDMGHFLTMARLGRRYPGNTGLIEIFGQMYEDYTEEVGNQDPTRPGFGSSANTPEDAISNGLGASFGAGLVDDKPLSEQLQQFFDDAGAKDPRNSWNYSFLPDSESEWEHAWQTDKEKATRKIGIVLDEDHPFWSAFPPQSPEVVLHTANDEIWGPIAFPR